MSQSVGRRSFERDDEEGAEHFLSTVDWNQRQQAYGRPEEHSTTSFYQRNS